MCLALRKRPECEPRVIQVHQNTAKRALQRRQTGKQVNKQAGKHSRGRGHEREKKVKQTKPEMECERES